MNNRIRFIMHKYFPFEIKFVVYKDDVINDFDSRTFSISDVSCSEWYDSFIKKICYSIENREYLPVCRFSDGEFLFMFGEPFPIWDNDIKKYLIEILKYFKYRYFSFKAGMEGVYVSGIYTQKERKKILSKYFKLIKNISQNGILALHLSYGKNPFQERFFPEIVKFFDKNFISVNGNNYFPFYFVYIAFSSNDLFKILFNRKILIINSASIEKQNKIKATLKKFNVSDVYFYNISSERSIYDDLDIVQYKNKVDIVLMGAGIGKVFLFEQLSILSVPCLDIGFILEVWSDNSLAKKRPYCNNLNL